MMKIVALAVFCLAVVAKSEDTAPSSTAAPTTMAPPSGGGGGGGGKPQDTTPTTGAPIATTVTIKPQTRRAKCMAVSGTSKAKCTSVKINKKSICQWKGAPKGGNGQCLPIVNTTPTPRPGNGTTTIGPAATTTATTVNPDTLPSLAGLVTTTPTLSTLLAAVKTAGLVKTLSTAGTYTVFAPNDAAFARVPKAALNALLANKKQLKQVILNHVLAAQVLSTDIAMGEQTVDTVSGGVLLVTKTAAGVTVANADRSVFANVIAADKMANNGVAHIIDAVLLPPAPAPPATTTTIGPSGGNGTTATTTAATTATPKVTTTSNTPGGSGGGEDDDGSGGGLETTTSTVSTVTTVTTLTTTTTVTTVTTVTTTTGTTTTTVSAKCTKGQFYVGGDVNECRPCPDGQYQDFPDEHTITECMPWKECVSAEGQTEKDAPSKEQQRTCYTLPGKSCVSADPKQYEKYSEEIKDEEDAGEDLGSGTSGYVKQTRLICGFTEQCPKGWKVTLAASDKMDVECQPCEDVDEGMAFSNTLDAAECTPWQKCNVGFFWEQPSGSSTSDIACVACETGKFQLLENERVTECKATTTADPGVNPTEAPFGPGSGPGNAGNSSNSTLPVEAKSDLNLYIIIGAACGGTIVLLVIGMLISRSCKRKASYLTASAWSNSANRTWQGGYDEHDDDEDLLGGM